MNFNPREKVLLSFLAVIAVGALYVNLFLIPQLNFINKTKQEIQQFQQTNKANELIKKAVGGIDSDLKILTQKFKELRAVFPPNINQEELLIVLRDISRDSEVFIDSITFTEPVEVKEKEENKDAQTAGSQSKDSTKKDANSAGSTQTKIAEDITNIKITNEKLKETMSSLGLDSEGNVVNEKESQKAKIIRNGKAYTLDAKVSAKGSNSQIKSFLSRIELLKNKSVIKDLTINKEETGILTVNMTIEFFGIMDRKAGAYTMLPDGTWRPLDTGDKDNIFKTYDGYKGPVKIQESRNSNNNGNKDNKADNGNSVIKALTEMQKYDFTVSLLPFGNGMAPPTVTIAGKHVSLGNQSSFIPVIYGDNKGEEKVEFSFEEKGGKIISRFSTQSESCPQKGSDQEAEVTTAGDDIVILIDSLAKKGKDDTAGANITIANKTNKKVVVDVKGEQQASPRARINKAAGNIEVNYK